MFILYLLGYFLAFYCLLCLVDLNAIKSYPLKMYATFLPVISDIYACKVLCFVQCNAATPCLLLCIVCSSLGASDRQEWIYYNVWARHMWCR